MVVRLDREHGEEWRPLSAEAARGESRDPGGLPAQDAGDLAFEHRRTGAIISMNSVCREHRDSTLEELSRNLLMGLNTQGQAATRDLEVDGSKALESTVDAGITTRRPSGETEEMPVRVRAVVLRKSGCTYDLMYIARPAVFDELSPVFDRFLKGFHAQ